MLRFEQRLAEILFEARNQAVQVRNVNGITSMDVFFELIMDPDGFLYAYLVSLNTDEKISEKILEFSKEFAKSEEEEYGENFEFSIYNLETNNYLSIKTVITKELYFYLQAAEKITKCFDGDEILIQDVMLAMVQNPTKRMISFLGALDVDAHDMQIEMEEAYLDNFYEDEIQEGFISRDDMSNYLYEFTGDETILGRDKEIESAWNILLKKTKRNIILVGDQGVGKTAIVKKMVSQIQNGTAPKEFKDFKIFCLDVTAIISGTKYRGDAEARFTKLLSFIKQRQDVILFIDEAHLIMGAGSSEGTNLDLANALKPILAGDSSRVIAATTTREYEKYFSLDPAMKRRFEKVTVDEPGIYEVYSMIQARIEELSKYHGVKITHHMVDFIALYASCFSKETKNPDRTLDLVDRSMVAAKRKNKRFVDRGSVLSNFKVNMELFNSISEESKRATAYHEAGHYIAFSFLPFLARTQKPVVVSIYPAEDYFGVTVTEKRKNVLEVRSKRAYLENIASCMAGGIAEGKVNKSANDGVSSDAEQATHLAKILVTQTGFYNDFFYNLNALETEKSIEGEVKEIKKILVEAKKIAEEVINSHLKELEAVAEALMSKHVCSDEELKKIISNVTESSHLEKSVTTV